MASKKKIVKLNSPEAMDYLSKLYGMPVSYGSKSTEKKEEKKNG